MDTSNAICPSRNGFSNAIIGAGVNSSILNERNVIVSEPIGSVFEALTDTLDSTKAMTIELWFSLEREFGPADDSKEFVLLELGGYNGEGNSLGINENNYQIRISMIWRDGQLPRFKIQIQNYGGEDDEGFVTEFSASSFLKLGDPSYVGNQVFLC